MVVCGVQLPVALLVAVILACRDSERVVDFGFRHVVVQPGYLAHQVVDELPLDEALPLRRFVVYVEAEARRTQVVDVVEVVAVRHAIRQFVDRRQPIDRNVALQRMAKYTIYPLRLLDVLSVVVEFRGAVAEVLHPRFGARCRRVHDL